MEVLKDPADLEQANRQTMIKDLNDVYNSIEKLIQRTYVKKETDLNFQLRNIRTSASQLLADIKNKDLDGFSGKKGTLQEFYDTENRLLEESARMKDLFSSISLTEDIDVFMLEDILDSFKKGFNDRITVDKDVQKEFKLKQMEAGSAERVMSGERQIPVKKEPSTLTKPGEEKKAKISDSANVSKTILAPSLSPERSAGDIPEKTSKEDIGTDVLSKLYNCMNVLEHKYSTYQPEVSFNGEYIGDRKWKVDVSDRSVSGIIMDNVLKPLITFETYWHPFDEQRTIMQFVQGQANAVPQGQYKSLCLLNSGWNAEIKTWSRNYIHPRLVLYLYDLETDETLFNKDVERADRLKVWHDLENYVPLENKIAPLIEQDEPFDASDVAEITGLNAEGAQKFIVTMLSKNKVIDVGFGTSRYTGMK